MDGKLDTAKHVGDALAAGITVGAVLSWLPHVAAVLSIVWFTLRIANEWHTWKTRRR